MYSWIPHIAIAFVMAKHIHTTLQSTKLVVFPLELSSTVVVVVGRADETVAQINALRFIVLLSKTPLSLACLYD